jgi:hypothetical protein
MNFVCVLFSGAQLESLVGIRVITPPSLGLDESSSSVASGPPRSSPPPDPPLDPPEPPELPLEPLLPPGLNGAVLDAEEQLAIG